MTAMDAASSRSGAVESSMQPRPTRGNRVIPARSCRGFAPLRQPALRVAGSRDGGDSLPAAGTAYARRHAVSSIRGVSVTLDDLRRFAVAHSLFVPATLQGALDVFGFVQADPIRAPARAQDLTLRHRVRGYRAGDLERRYAELEIEEDHFVNYGFVPRTVHALMHPRDYSDRWPAATKRRARRLFAFVRQRGQVHPREVDGHFSHGTVVNYWGGSSNATTHLMEQMHYAGLLRVVRRDTGIRIYAARELAPVPATPAARDGRLDALVDVAVRTYGPLPAPSLSTLVSRLRYAAPQWTGELKEALQRARERLAHARVDGIDWFWLPGE